MLRIKIVNGETVELTAKENAEIDAREQAWADGENERQWEKVREEREPLLIEADFLVNKAQDNGDTANDLVSRSYRQELRDITNQADPFNIVWPTKPR